MLFSEFSNYLQEIEQISSRLSMTEKLSQLFKISDSSEIDIICYLSLGILAPGYTGIEMMLADKMMIRAIAQSLNCSVQDVVDNFKESGDLGLAYQNLASQKVIKTGLTVAQVYEKLLDIAKDNGMGSQLRKLEAMSQLLKLVSPIEGKFIVRMALKKLRTGFSEMTILDGLSWMETGDKSLHPALETAFNLRADIGQIASIFKQGGISEINKLIPQVGTPIRPAKATPLTDPTEILEKMNNLVCLEPKYDGFRVQIHLDKNRENPEENSLSLFNNNQKKAFVQIFSRNLENTTAMFPDLVKAVQDLPVQSVILDGEALAYDPQTGETLDFQETVKRKRKHEIEKISNEIPLRAYIFDIMFWDNESTIQMPFSQRRAILEKIFNQVEKLNSLTLAPQIIAKNIDDLNKFFKQMIKEKREGLMAKKIDSIYKAGARDFTWVKYKLGMQSDMADTVDAVVMGYFKGQGKWSQFGLGKVLVGLPDGDNIIALTRLGSGFSEETIAAMYQKCQEIKIDKKPTNYIVDKNLIPDVWVEPKLVIEIRADSISKSTLYQAGLSLRFPRFRQFREDKNVADATSITELKQIASI